MQSHLSRAIRLGAVALCSIAVTGVGADAASALTIRTGTTTTLPTSSSSALANNQFIGADGLFQPAAFQGPGGSGTCTNGKVANRVLNNGSTPINHDMLSLLIDTCTDNNANYDLVNIRLNTFGTAQLTSATTLVVTNPTFKVRIRTVASGTVVDCDVVLNSGTSVTGTVSNGSPAGGTPNTTNTTANTEPSIAFNNVDVKTTSTGVGACSSNIGTGGTVPSSASRISVRFRPLRVVNSGVANGAYVGVF